MKPEVQNNIWQHFIEVTDYLGIIAWFVVVIAAKMSLLMKNKKLSKQEIISNILYCLVGGVMAYLGTFSFKYQFRYIAAGIGCLAGDVLIGWLPDNVKEWLQLVGTGIKTFIKNKFK